MESKPFLTNRSDCQSNVSGLSPRGSGSFFLFSGSAVHFSDWSFEVVFVFIYC